VRFIEAVRRPPRKREGLASGESASILRGRRRHPSAVRADRFGRHVLAVDGHGVLDFVRRDLGVRVGGALLALGLVGVAFHLANQGAGLVLYAAAMRRLPVEKDILHRAASIGPRKIRGFQASLFGGQLDAAHAVLGRMVVEF
jgi:hypothetical protein